MKSLGVALVGCGRIADLHELGYRDLGEARIVALCDRRKGRAKAKARAWGVTKVYGDYEQVLEDPEVQLVELLVPHHLHAPMTIAACAAGKHVSVQKPMALTVEEADGMIAAAESAGVVLRVYENFVFYPPFVRAKEMIDAGAIGEPQMIRLHVGTGGRGGGWKVPLSSWLWRFDEKKCGGGPLVFDHGYHLFSIARHLMGEVERVYAWIDSTPEALIGSVDAPATIMFQFKAPRRYGVLDFTHTPKMRIASSYYADDDRVEVVGERGILFINRCTARTVDLPEVLMFRDGNTSPVPVGRVAWHDSFIDCTRHLIAVLQDAGDPVLDGLAGRATLQFTLAAQISAREGREVHPDQVV
jgi:predicted dehydrogenase